MTSDLKPQTAPEPPENLTDWSKEKQSDKMMDDWVLSRAQLGIKRGEVERAKRPTDRAERDPGTR